ncbi:MAG: DNA-binding response regulator [Bacteroidetes bacterium]|nr:DNA-binding response regulator [Rhodothermaceae bacterium RA]RMH63111.1 MAG: DNA-binding response regulator [Bacteroidota bacterium]
MWILVIEDDPFTQELLVSGLEENGYQVDAAADGIEGETLARTNDYDAIIVDWMLPGQSGPALTKRLRTAGINAPVLMLTSLTDVEDRVHGLDSGADDYLTKPFSFEELFARLRALLRRRQALMEETHLKAGVVTVDTRRRLVFIDGESLELRSKEYGLMELFVRNKGTVLTRTVIAERVWGTALGVTDDVINTTVSSLRRKLSDAVGGDGAASVQIRTIRGVGYCLDDGEIAAD